LRNGELLLSFFFSVGDFVERCFSAGILEEEAQNSVE
jgi:hypothetical protein